MHRFLLLFIIMLVVISTPALATSPAGEINIELDGLILPVSADSLPRAINGRTLVPLRALSEALGGTVAYDDITRTASVTRDNTLLTFPLDIPVMTINGEAKVIDVAAQAFGGRAFIPARYLAEALGSTVGWNEPSRTVIIQTIPINRELIGCYALESAKGFQTYGENLHRAMVQWATLELKDEQVALRASLPPGYEILATEWAVTRGVDLSLQVFSEDTALLTLLLTGTTESRLQVAQSIIDLTVELGFSGVNLDLEGIMQTSLQEGLNNFVTILSALCKEQSLHFSAYVPPKLRLTDYAAYNFEFLAGQVDQLIIMAHDLVRPWNEPGPPAPLSWVERVLQFALQTGKVPKDKLVLGVSLHGVNWPKELPGTVYQQALSTFTPEWLAERGLTHIPLDHTQGMGYLEYLSPNDGTRVLWTETVESIAAKVALLNKYNIAGVSFWRLGAASPELFETDGPFSGFRP